MDGTRMILVVCEDPGRTGTWTGWLEGSGYSTMRCSGPTEAPCPRLAGLPCALRQIADAAVVEVQGPDQQQLHGEVGERGCTTLPDDGTTIFVAAGDIGARATLRHPVAPTDLLGAVERALARRAQLG
ncbi:MAG TPA: hypothetical protein VGB52_05470 [Actinomycetota bacterium]|jgi:hypothetical protein